MPDLISRSKFESRLTDELVRVFDQYLSEIKGLLSGADTKLGDLKKVPADLYSRLQSDLAEVMQEVLIEAYIAAFSSMDGHLADNTTRASRRGALFIRNDATQWASFYAPKLAKDIANTTKSDLRRIAERSPALPISGIGIRDVIKGSLDINRAGMIARTEITNVIPIAEQKAQGTFELNLKVVMYWFTKKDERVCIICRPRHKKPRGSNWQMPPPAHPRCRCEPYYKVTYPDGSIIWIRATEEIEAGWPAVTKG